jgi:hypothetical protein
VAYDNVLGWVRYLFALVFAMPRPINNRWLMG